VFTPGVFIPAFPYPEHLTEGVYVVQTCPGFVKVGRASDVFRRIQDLQVCTPYPVRFLGLLSTNQLDEAHYHELFEPYRERGEWFRLEGVVEETIRAQAVPPPLREATPHYDGEGDDDDWLDDA